jgi:hypothetical protein
LRDFYFRFYIMKSIPEIDIFTKMK